MKRKIIVLSLLLVACASYAKPPALFVQQAKSAVFTAQKSGCYMLSLTGANSKMLYFSTAPGNKAGFSGTQEIFSAWEKVNKKPNGAFAGTDHADHEHAYAFKLTNPVLDKETGNISYTACALDKAQTLPMLNKAFNHVSLFIDQFHNWPP